MFLSSSFRVMESFSDVLHSFFLPRSRIGIAMFLLSLPLLTGAPLQGALLHPPEYTWWRGVTFSGVRPVVQLLTFPSNLIGFIYSDSIPVLQVVQLCGVSLMVLSRSMVARRKGTWRV